MPSRNVDRENLNADYKRLSQASRPARAGVLAGARGGIAAAALTSAITADAVSALRAAQGANWNCCTSVPT